MTTPQAGTPVTSTLEALALNEMNEKMNENNPQKQNPYIHWFNEIAMEDVPSVGGKNASLGEMYQELGQAGIKVPYGFAITAKAYFDFMEESGADKMSMDSPSLMSSRKLSGVPTTPPQPIRRDPIKGSWGTQ